MSTFNGLVTEFPDIRIDFFRQHANAPPPLACFLSHVHSDHLAGLDSLRSPFVYCSAATREILLRLERYPCRINYAKGILEARQQTYKHLAKVLKPLPLETPSVIELQPGCEIQVTLFDANHCPGAVMFLIEGDGKAVLYTGDIRSEPWFVNALARNPILIEYTCSLKTLDKIYLDTSFTNDVSFQTKAEGISELLRKVSKYPDETVFHIQAWTYGYEEVWIALSKALKSPVHVDDYKMRIYNSLRNRVSNKQSMGDFHIAAGAAALTGHICGNTPHPGCLTSDQNVRLHSCEKGNMCDKAKGSNVVKIQPIIARLPGGGKLEEVGVGGGGEDLEREAELALPLPENVLELLELVSASTIMSVAEQNAIRSMIGDITARSRSLLLNLDASTFREGQSTDLQAALRTLAQVPRDGRQMTLEVPTGGLPRVIQFPYSRHSSYPELRHLVKTFQPKDVWPCTVSPEQWIEEGLSLLRIPELEKEFLNKTSADISIKSLFGGCCSGEVFGHDLVMAALAEGSLPAASQDTETQPTDDASRSECHPVRDMVSAQVSSPLDPPLPGETSMPQHVVNMQRDSVSLSLQQPGDEGPKLEASDQGVVESGVIQDSTLLTRKRKYGGLGGVGDDENEQDNDDSQRTEASITSVISMRHSLSRLDAYYHMLDNAADQGSRPITLLCADGDHGIADEEL